MLNSALLKILPTKFFVASTRMVVIAGMGLYARVSGRDSGGGDGSG